MPGGSNYTTAGTHVLKSGSGVLDAVIINGGTMGTITIYDNVSAADRKIATITPSIGMVFPYCCEFAIGLTIVLAANTDITVVFV